MEASKSSVGRYATRTNNAMQRLLEAQAQTDRLIQVVKENPEADYTEAAILLTMNGLLNKVATAEEEFNEMPLDKAGRLIASLSRTKVYKDRVKQDMRKKPEDGEEVLKPPQNGVAMGQPSPMETAEELKLKQVEGQTEQVQVDTIVSVANKQAEGIFREMVKPIFKMIDKAEDMEELQKVLKDEKKLRELYQEMESPELEDLIQQGIYLSHLIGRSMD